MKTEEQLIGSLIANTSTKKRPQSIWEIANDINELARLKGGKNEVAQIIGISSNMLNKFLAVLKLSTPLQNWVKERKLDSVEVIYSLAKFPEATQLIIAENVINNNLSSQDVRALGPYIKQHPKADIDKLIDQLLKSKNIKVYVLQFPVSFETSFESFRHSITSIVGEENIILLENVGNIVTLKVNKKGEYKLRDASAKSGISLSKFINALLNK